MAIPINVCLLEGGWGQAAELRVGDRARLLESVTGCPGPLASLFALLSLSHMGPSLPSLRSCGED